MQPIEKHSTRKTVDCLGFLASPSASCGYAHPTLCAGSASAPGLSSRETPYFFHLRSLLLAQAPGSAPRTSPLEHALSPSRPGSLVLISFLLNYDKSFRPLPSSAFTFSLPSLPSSPHPPSSLTLPPRGSVPVLYSSLSSSDILWKSVPGLALLASWVFVGLPDSIQFQCFYFLSTPHLCFYFCLQVVHLDFSASGMMIG